MKKLIVSICVLFVVGLLVYTCPTQEMHKQAVTNVLKQYVKEEVFNEKASDSNNAIAAFIGAGMTQMACDYLMDMEVKSFLVFSVGYLPSIDKHVSVGVLNHVFTFGVDDVRKELDKMFPSDLHGKK